MPRHSHIPRVRASIHVIRAALVLLALTGTLWASCARSSEMVPTPSPSQIALLTPYHTLTLTPTLAAQPLGSQDPTLALETPTPTATPVTYTVKGGDTMLGIALRYGIPLEALKTANPEVDPQIMSIGTRLIIPLTQAPATPTPSPTPLPLALSAPQCYREADGGLWCLLMVSNDQAMAFENLSAQVGLYASDGALQAEKMAFALLNLLTPGGKIPLLVEFPAPVDPAWQVRAKLFDALPVDAGSSRYLEATVEGLEVEVADEGQFARLRGEVRWVAQPSAPRLIWLVAVAYDAADRAVGARRLEISYPCDGEPQGESTTTPTACASASFDFTVYSLDTAIHRVEALVEAQP